MPRCCKLVLNWVDATILQSCMAGKRFRPKSQIMTAFAVKLLLSLNHYNGRNDQMAVLDATHRANLAVVMCVVALLSSLDYRPFCSLYVVFHSLVMVSARTTSVSVYNHLSHTFD